MSVKDVYRVSLFGVDFSPVFEGSYLTLRTLTGWYGVTDARGETHARAGASGRFERDLPPLRDSRAITITAVLHAESRDMLEYYRHNLAQRLNGKGLLVVSDSRGSFSAVVETQGVNIANPPPGQLAIPVTVDLLAYDPYKYSYPARTVYASPPVSIGGLRFSKRFPYSFGKSEGGFIEINNIGGQVGIAPVFEISGVGKNIEITAQGQLVAVSSWQSDLPLIIDSGLRRAFSAGTAFDDVLTAREFFTVPPGRVMRVNFNAREARDLILTVKYSIGVM